MMILQVGRDKTQFIQEIVTEMVRAGAFDVSKGKVVLSFNDNVLTDIELLLHPYKRKGLTIPI
ncbi:MAG: hypothetical protein HYZ54_13660 [Ignavibacteriae bacterium]|nr:hypothetical protein [Ignavibacteriota bacterium]